MVTSEDLKCTGVEVITTSGLNYQCGNPPKTENVPLLVFYTITTSGVNYQCSNFGILPKSYELELCVVLGTVVLFIPQMQRVCPNSFIPFHF